MRIASLAAGIAAVFLAVAATAQTAPPSAAVLPSPLLRFKGTIDSFDAGTRTLMVKGTDGQSMGVVLLPDARIYFDQMKTLMDIKQGDFVGSSTLKGPDGVLHAQEVHLYPSSMAGMGEGQYPLSDSNLNRNMTNATVAQVTSVSANSGTLALSYHGAQAMPDGSCTGRANAAGSAGCVGNAQIKVMPGIPIFAVVPGDETLLVPGAAVSLKVTVEIDGTITTRVLTVERNGTKPVM
jgi:hypothetical protein